MAREIADSEKCKVVERFYRGDASRGTPGVGLGLSLGAGGAKLHGSALELSTGNPGLRVRSPFPFDAASLVALAAPQQETATGEVTHPHPSLVVSHKSAVWTFFRRIGGPDFRGHVRYIYL